MNIKLINSKITKNGNYEELIMSHYQNVVNELKNISEKIFPLSKSYNWEIEEEILSLIKIFGSQIESNSIKTDKDLESLKLIKSDSPELFINIVYDNLMLLIKEYEQLIAIEKHRAIVYPFDFSGMQMALLKDEEGNHRFIYETMELIEEVNDQLNVDTEVVIFVGYGSGLIHSYLKENYYVLTIDPFYISKSLSDDVISLHNPDGVSQLTQHFSSFIGLKTKIIPHPQYINSLYFVNSLRQVRDLWQTAQIELTTRVLHTEKWYKQSLLNTEILRKNTNRILNIETMKNVHKGERALMIAGGPSLEESLPYLKKVQEYYFIVSIGQTVKVLLENGIKPDYVVSIDTEMANVHFFKEMELDVPLVYPLQLNHQIPKYAKGVLIPYPDNEVSKKLLSYSNTLLETAPSVALSAVSFMNYVGFDSIGLIGQDLALRQGEYYSASVKRAASNEGQLNSSLYDVELNNGEKGKTTPILLNFLRGYKNIMNIYPDLNEKLINYSEYGAKIENVLYDPIENIVNHTVKKVNPPLHLGIEKDLSPSIENITDIFSLVIMDLDKAYRKLKRLNNLKAIDKKDYHKALRDWNNLIEAQNFRTYVMPLQIVNLIVIQNKIKLYNHSKQLNQSRLDIIKLMYNTIRTLNRQLREFKDINSEE